MGSPRFPMRRWAPLVLVLSALHLFVWGRILLWPTVSLVEIEWTLAAAVGAAYSGWFLWQNWQNLLAWRRAGRNGEIRLTAEILVVIGWVLLVVHLVFVSLGVLSFFVASPPVPGDGPRAWLQSLVPVVYAEISQGLVLALLSIQQKRQRLLRRREGEGASAGDTN
jgi:DMSO/TMAO reductase YedYZ heme-binding membrane subunit